jgi:hypothetical protein
MYTHKLLLNEFRQNFSVFRLVEKKIELFIYLGLYNDTYPSSNKNTVLSLERF